MKIAKEELEVLYDILITITIGFAIESAIYYLFVCMGVFA